MQPCIGLFGTVSGSRWRDAFVTRYQAENITFFNPKKKGWSMDDAAIETRHMMVDDKVVLFAITNETVGFNPLAEIGFAALAIATSVTPRYLVVYTDPTVDAEKIGHEPSTKGSVKCRGLVKSHLTEAQRQFPKRIYIVDSLDEMLELSILLYYLPQ